MRRLFKQKNKEKGFTILETMVSVSLFIVVVIVGMGSLLNTTLLHKKSQSIGSIMDNLSFIIEDMSRNLRTGYDYHCIINDADIVTTDTKDCLVGKGVSFKSSLGNQWIYLISTNGDIQKSIDGGLTFTILTPPEIKIDSALQFFVSGALPPPQDTRQPFVTIRLIGSITSQGNVEPFSLQTSVSSRLVDIN